MRNSLLLLVAVVTAWSTQSPPRPPFSDVSTPVEAPVIVQAVQSPPVAPQAPVEAPRAVPGPAQVPTVDPVALGHAMGDSIAQQTANQMQGIVNLMQQQNQAVMSRLDGFTIKLAQLSNPTNAPASAPDCSKGCSGAATCQCPHAVTLRLLRVQMSRMVDRDNIGTQDLPKLRFVEDAAGHLHYAVASEPRSELINEVARINAAMGSQTPVPSVVVLPPASVQPLVPQTFSYNSGAY